MKCCDKKIDRQEFKMIKSLKCLKSLKSLKSLKLSLTKGCRGLKIRCVEEIISGLVAERAA